MKKNGSSDKIIQLQIRKSLLTLLWGLQEKLRILTSFLGNSPMIELKGDYRDIHHAKEMANNAFDKNKHRISESDRLLLAAIFYRFWHNSQTTSPQYWNALETIRFYLNQSQRLNPLKIPDNLPDDYLPLSQLDLNSHPQGTRGYIDTINDYIDDLMDYQSNEVAVQLIYALDKNISTEDIVFRPRRHARYQVRNEEGYIEIIELNSGNWLVLAMINTSIKIKHYKNGKTNNTTLRAMQNPLEYFGYINELCGMPCSTNYLFYPYDVKISEMRTPGVFSETPSDNEAFESFWQDFYIDETEVFYPRLRLLHINQPYKFIVREIINPFVVPEDKGLKFLLESRVKLYLSEITKSLKRQPPQNTLYKIASIIVPFYDVIYRNSNDRKYIMTPSDIQSLIMDSISVIVFVFSAGAKLTENLANRLVRSVRTNHFRGLRGKALTSAVLRESPVFLMNTFSDTLPSFLRGFYGLFEPVPLLDFVRGIQKTIHRSGIRLRDFEIRREDVSQSAQTRLRPEELKQYPPRQAMDNYINVSASCKIPSKNRKRGALLCAAQRNEETLQASNDQIINAFYQSMDDILYIDKKIESKRNYLTRFEAGVRNHQQPDYDWLDILSPRQKLIYFNTGVAPDRFPRELGPAVRGALSEKIIIDLKKIEAAGIKNSADTFFHTARANWGGSEILYLPQSSFIKELSPGLCKPVSSLMALALKNGRMLQFADALKTLERQSEFYQFLDQFHRGGEAGGRFKNSLLQSGKPLTFTKEAPPLEMHLFSNTTSSAEISTSVHAMSVTKSFMGGTITYFFYDPNYGVVSFSQYDQMTGFIAEHLAYLKLKLGNPYHFSDELLVKKINFNSAEYLLRSSPEVHKILIE